MFEYTTTTLVRERATTPTIDTGWLAQAEAEICVLAANLHASRARLLNLVGAFDARQGWAVSGHTSCAHWLAQLVDIELSTAREHVRCARALRVLPRTRTLFDTGDLSYAKLRQLSRAATPENEEALLAVAATTPASRIGVSLARWQQRHEPDRLRQRQQQARGFHYNVQADGLHTITVRLMPEDAAEIMAVIDSHTRRVPSGEGRTLAQRRVEAFLAAITTPLPATPLPATPLPATPLPARPDTAHHPRPSPPRETASDPKPDVRASETESPPPSTETPGSPCRGTPGSDTSNQPPPNAEQHVAEKSAAESSDASGRAAGPATAGLVVAGQTPLIRPELIVHRRVGDTELADGTILPKHIARYFTCDSDIRVMTHYPNGSPADVGRRHRLVTPRLRQLVLERDKHCQHPGCHATTYLQIHHRIHWEDNGPTSLANLHPYCHTHHRRIHHLP